MLGAVCRPMVGTHSALSVGLPARLHTQRRHGQAQTTQQNATERPLVARRAWMRYQRRTQGCSKAPVHDKRRGRTWSVAARARRSKCVSARAAWCMRGAGWLPSTPRTAMKCADTGQQQRMLSESVVSSHPLDLHQARPSCDAALTCGTPPARARRAFKVKVGLGPLQRRHCRSSL